MENSDTEKEYNEFASKRYEAEFNRRLQADRIGDLGFNFVADQLYYWDQHHLTPEELCRGKQSENDQA